MAAWRIEWRNYVDALPLLKALLGDYETPLFRKVENVVGHTVAKKILSKISISSDDVLTRVSVFIDESEAPRLS